MDIEGRTDWRGFYACEGFPYIISRGFLASSWGAYNHRLNLVNIDGVTFWSKCFTVGTNFMEAYWPPRVTHSVAIAM